MRLLLLSLFVLLPTAASAHSTEGLSGGLVSGLLHPVFGPDHLVAMVAVGLWGAQLGRPLVFALPIAFPMMMALGGLMGMLQVPMIAVEIGIAISALVLGLVVLMALRAPHWLAVALVGVFAIFHGYAHGTELPEASNAIAYGAGFLISTGLLHLGGILIGLAQDWRPAGPGIVRGCGGLIACVGAFFVMRSVGVV